MSTGYGRFKGPDGQEDMPYLLTPGPLTTSRSVKLAMLADWGSRDIEFRAMVADIRQRLLAMAGASKTHQCVIMQGSGTFAIEAAIGSFCTGKTLVVINGAYGQRAAKILDRLGRAYLTLDKGESAVPAPEEIAAILDAQADITHVWVVHCETTSGIVNPVAGIAQAAAERGCKAMVDAMSSFGALPLDLAADGIDAMVSSSSKCLEGVPGFAFVIGDTKMLEASRGKSHSVALDLFEQWRGLEDTGQFRFTPPTHAIAAFQQALREHAKEGGVAARGARYQRNANALVDGMRGLGFKTLLDGEDAGPIVQTFLSPADLDLDVFHGLLRRRGFVIYPGKLTATPSFRIGTIGQVDEKVMAAAVAAVKAVLGEMNVTVPTT